MTKLLTKVDPLLQGIIDNPQDDDRRLIYADWLEEHGQPERAEFIRCQVKLARHEAVAKLRGSQFPAPPVPDDWLGVTGAEALRRRKRELLGAHGRLWLPLPSNNNIRGDRAGFVTASGNQGEFTFHRGFVASVTLPCADWLRHGPALVRAAPLMTVWLSHRRPSSLFRTPYGDWYWVRQHGDTDHIPDRLPPALYGHLPDGVWEDEDGVMIYPTEAAALDALSVACLEYAKGKHRRKK